MTKFNVSNVGDKVRILDAKIICGNGTGRLTTGNEYEILSFHEKCGGYVEHIKIADNFSNPFTICDWEYKYIEIVEAKPTKNQRITALENEVAELRPLKQEVAELKLIVHELRGKKSIEPSTTNTVEDKPLTPNQQRAEIIEKAKKFVKENLANGRTSNRTAEKGNSTYRDNYYEVDFFVKEGKITAVVYWLVSNERRIVEPSNVGRAKCSPNDVFNEHIGKAIAIGRALGLDVSEFEQAVQPTVAIGQLLARKNNKNNHTRWKVDDLNDTGKNLTIIDNEFESLNGETADGGYLPTETWYTIINDTNAIYEVES